jgi:signal transduction histidine kinase
MELLYRFGFWITVICSSGLGLFVLSKNPRSTVNITWCLMCLSVSVWAAGLITCLFSSNYTSALWVARISQYAAILIATLFLHFSLALIGKSVRSDPVALFAYAFALVMMFFVFSDLFVPAVEPKSLFSYWPAVGPLFVAYTVQFCSLVVYSHVLLIRHLKHQPPRRRNQILAILPGTILGFCCGSVSFLFTYGVPVQPIPSAFTFIYTIIISWAILKHQIMDIRIVVTRTSVLLGTYLIVLGAPFLVGFLGKRQLVAQLGQEWWLVPLGLCTALATAGPFTYAFLRRQAEERLLRDQRRYQRALQQAARGMTRVRRMGKLSRLIVKVVGQSVRLRHVTLFIFDRKQEHYGLVAIHGEHRPILPSGFTLPHAHPLIERLKSTGEILNPEDLVATYERPILHELARLDAALVVPGIVEEELIGLLVLGGKLSGEGYSGDDLHAFSTLAHEAAIALENARSYEELLKLTDELRRAGDRLVRQERLAAAGQFAAGMAHEIKNPLAAIRTFVEFLPERYGDPVFREKFFRIVQGEIGRINKIVRDLLDFAKPSPLQVRAVDIRELVDDTVELLSGQCLKQGIEISRILPDVPLTIGADPQQLRQAMLNIIFNSLEAMLSGGRLRVEVASRGPSVIIRVSDTGPGILDADRQRLFDPFFTTKERGMGLGLAIVKGIIDRHGGQIRLDGRPGQGTTVEVVLPTGRVPSPSASESAPALLPVG